MVGAMDASSPTAPSGFDADLIARYDVRGPRYTSYPTAPQFQRSFGEAELRAAASASNRGAAPRRLSLYVHVPFCLNPCFYCGCTRLITRDHGKAVIYLDYLNREIALAAPLFDRTRPLVQLHFGGGTPNFLDEAQMQGLLESLARHFTFSTGSEREFGIELDPRSCDASYVHMLARHGFNRVSIGVQDFDPAVQEAVNRVQSVDETRVIVDAARASGMRSVSLDLIYGLPKQTLDGFARTLDQVIELRPDRVACYAYAHLPERFKAQRQIDAQDLPDAATRLLLLGLSVRKLIGAGYRHIGMDHFALPGDDLVQAQAAGKLQRNFQGYSTHGDCDLIGLGMSSISHIGNTFSQNAADLPKYYAALGAGRLPVVRGLASSGDDVIRADAIQQLMCQGVLEFAPFAARHGIDFRAYFSEALGALSGLQADGLVDIAADRIRVLPRGRFLLRNIAMCFDAYLTPQHMPEVRYSKAV
jgi:oxygen-independent coproporphyrinogen-3 oxidase